MKKNYSLTRISNKTVYKKLIGEGAFGIVQLYQCKPECNDSMCNNCYIVKHLLNTSKNYLGFLSRKDKDRIEKFYQEYEIGILLNHPNIRRTLDIDKKLNCITFENCRGIDLLDYANEYKTPNTRHLLGYFSQILEAVDYLHTNGIAHLDLKLENIVLNTHTNVIKLIDFGEASFFKDQQNNNYMFNGIRGTVQYLPPESVNLTEFQGDKTDIWCCGIILYNLFYNYHPWELAKCSDDKYNIHYFNITRGLLNQIIFPKRSEYYTETEWEIIKYLFKTLLNPEPKNRISINKTKSIFGLLDLSDNTKCSCRYNKLLSQNVANKFVKKHTI
jgi:serine/threonine protein kinase